MVNVIDGYRRTWTPEKSMMEVTLVFMFGGSTTLCAEAPDDLTISSELAKLLHFSQRQSRYVVVNYGVSGFVNDNEVHLLVDLLRSGKRPDIVIFLDGANEISNKVLKGIPHYRYNTYQDIGKRYSIRVFISKVASKFALIRFLKKVDKEKLTEDKNVIEARATEAVRTYARNIEFVDSLGAHYGFKTCF